MPKTKIPDTTIRRLPIYLRVLSDWSDEKVDVVSSAELAARTGFSSEQIRKDFAYFGAFGVRGVGYSASHLQERLRRILGLNKEVPVALVGAGNLGTALARYSVLRHRDVRVSAVFDQDWSKVGTTISGDLKVHHISDMPRVIQEQGIKMAIITVPAPEAEKAAQLLETAGVEAILNFAPVKLHSTKGTYVQNIDLTLELQSLAYYINPASPRDGAHRNDPDTPR